MQRVATERGATHAPMKNNVTHNKGQQNIRVSNVTNNPNNALASTKLVTASTEFWRIVLKRDIKNMLTPQEALNQSTLSHSLLVPSSVVIIAASAK